MNFSNRFFIFSSSAFPSSNVLISDASCGFSACSFNSLTRSDDIFSFLFFVGVVVLVLQRFFFVFFRNETKNSWEMGLRGVAFDDDCGVFVRKDPIDRHKLKYERMIVMRIFLIFCCVRHHHRRGRRRETRKFILSMYADGHSPSLKRTVKSSSKKKRY